MSYRKVKLALSVKVTAMKTRGAKGPRTPLEKLLEETIYTFTDGTDSATIEDTEMREVEVTSVRTAKVKFVLDILIDEGVEVSHFVHEVELKLPSIDEGQYLDTEFLEHEVIDSR